MGEDYQINNFCSFSLIDPKTNEVLLETDNVETNSVDVDHEEKEINADIKTNNNGSITMDIGNLHIEDAFLDIYNSPISDKEFRIEMDGIQEYKTQKKIHKKKRINKKWAKRYGYNVEKIPVRLEFPKCVINQDTQNVEILAKTVKEGLNK